ncbi:MAG: hypothetical protein QMC85_02355 [Methanocellales archaeon]|nr:hypothetical protein [Methanocellales archaeon]
MAKKSKMHKELFDWLRDENLPEKEIPRDEKEWFKEIAVGFSRLEMEKPDLSEYYKRAEERIKDENIKRIMRKLKEVGLIDYDSFRGIVQREWSDKYGFLVPSLIQSIDFVCIVGKRAWILEGKKEPDHTAIGQVLVYKDLFEQDYPDFEEVKRELCAMSHIPLMSLLQEN